MDKVLRILHMLQKIPQAPDKITIAQMLEHLSANGYNIMRRTVERDMSNLSITFPITNDETKPAGWYYTGDVGRWIFPALNATEALTLKLVQQYLTDLMPASVLNNLAPFFSQAHQEIAAMDDNTLQQWPNKIASVPASQPLLVPIIKTDVQMAVSQALLENKQLRLLYQSREQTEPAERIVHPLAMVSRGGLIYLIAAASAELDSIRLRLMHRIHVAEKLEAPSIRPEGFDLARFIDDGFLGFGQGRQLVLKVLFLKETAAHLYDTPLSTNQTIEEYDQNRVLVTATLADTQQLTWWLLGFGDKVEVIEPLALRQKFADIAARMSQNYQPVIPTDKPVSQTS